MPGKGIQAEEEFVQRPRSESRYLNEFESTETRAIGPQ